MVSSVVATGRWTKGAEKFMAAGVGRQASLRDAAYAVDRSVG
jgi:hypothetical protein